MKIIFAGLNRLIFIIKYFLVFYLIFVALVFVSDEFSHSIISNASAATLDFPVPQTTLQHKLSLSGTSTIVVVDANNTISKASLDNLGVANFRLAWSNDSRSFYDNTGKTYIFDKAPEAQLKALNIPMSRIYFTYFEAGGLHNGLDMLADVCNRNNMPQEKMIICIEHWQATSILNAAIYQDALSYVKTKGYKFIYWEISNEPQYAWGSGLDDPLIYARHVRNVYDSIKVINPSAKVGCQICRKSYYSDQVLSNIQGKADFIAGHWYGGQTNMDKYTVSDMILADNYKCIDYISYENQNIINRTGKVIPQIDTEWRLLASGTENGVVTSGEWNNKNGNIVGTLYQAVRLIYNIRDGYMSGGNCWHTQGTTPGTLVPSGYGGPAGNVNLNGKTSYLYWLYSNMIKNTGPQVVGFTGTAPSFTGKAIHNVDDGSSTADLSYTGPLTPMMITKSTDGNKLYITIVNGSTTATVPFSATVSNFQTSNVKAVQIHDNDVNQLWYQDDSTRFVTSPVVNNNSGVISTSLPPLSCTFIILTKSQSTAIAIPVVPILATPAKGVINQSLTPVLSWGASSGAVTYNLQVSTVSTFATTIINQSGLTNLSFTVPSLLKNTLYYWRVNATNTSGTSGWSTVNNFTTVINTIVVPVTNFKLSDTIICNGSTAIIQQAGSEQGINYQLQDKASGTKIGSIIAGTGVAIRYTVNPVKTTIYNVSLTNPVNGSVAIITDLSTVEVSQVPSIPEVPYGETSITLPSAQTYTYSVNLVAGAAKYVWSLSAADAGTITVAGASANIIWKGSTTKDVSILVSASNVCGTSAAAQPLSIALKSGISTNIDNSVVNNNPWNPEFFNNNPYAIMSVYDVNGKLISVYKNGEVGWANFNQDHAIGVYIYSVDFHDGTAPQKSKFISYK